MLSDIPHDLRYTREYNELYSIRILRDVRSGLRLLAELGVSVVLGVIIIGVFENDSLQIDIIAYVNVPGELRFLQEALRGIGISTGNVEHNDLVRVSLRNYLCNFSHATFFFKSYAYMCIFFNAKFPRERIKLILCK